MVLELLGKHYKLWEIYTLISPLHFILPPTLLPYFIPFLTSHIFCICDTPLNCYHFTRQSHPFAHLTSFRGLQKSLSKIRLIRNSYFNYRRTWCNCA